MSVTFVTTSGGWENRDTWPNRTKELVVTAFRDPIYGSPVTNAPTERAKLYPKDPDFHIMQRHKPQLAWREGTYDIPAHQGGYPMLCKYPDVVGPYKPDGTRECMQPGKLTAEEREKLKAQREINLAALNEQVPYERCPNPNQTVYQKDVDSEGYLRFFTCPAPGKFAYKRKPTAVRGLGALGETEAEKKEISNLKSRYRAAELTLAGSLALGLYLILKR